MAISVRAFAAHLRSVWLNLSLARKGVIVAGVPLATILLAAAPIVFNDAARVRADDAVARTRQARENAGTMLRQMLQAQNHMLGFILTGDSAQLAEFTEAFRAANDLLAATDSLITEPTTRPLFTGVRTRLAGLQAEMTHEIELARSSGRRPSSASAVLMLSQENRSIRDLETSIYRLIDAEDAVLAERATQLEQIRRRRVLLATLVVLLGALGTGMSAALFMTGVTGRVERMQLSATGVPEATLRMRPVAGTDEIGRLAVAIEESRQETARTADRLRLAIRAARIEVIEVRPEQDRLTVFRSGTLFRHLGYPSDRLPTTMSGFVQMIHPDDRERVADALRSVAPGWEYEVEFRMAGADSDWRWMELRGATPHLDGDVDAPATGVGAFASHAVAVGILLDVTERRTAEDQARFAMTAADRANQAKSEFVSRMSHELRTPLNAVLGFAQLLEIDVLTPDQKESVGHILRGGRYLLDLINEVLDLARIEAGRLGLSLEPVPVRDVIDTVVALVGPQATDFGVRLQVPAHTAGEFVHADRQRLQQVLLNLVSNAIKYNRRSGTVELDIEAADGKVRIHVQDTGPGLSPEHIQRLFQPFERLDAARTGIEGTGLGLALSRTIVEAMGGRILVESTMGVGSTFTVELEAEEVTDEQRATLAPFREPETTITVVYVEDNQANIRLVERIANRRPRIRIVSVDDGDRALSTIRKERPSLVLLDLNLPGLQGDQILERIRHDPLTADLPVAILSADATPAQAARLRELGAQHYLTKPIDVNQLLYVLDVCAREAGATAVR